MGIGFTLPFSKSTSEVGYFETTSTDIDAVKENLKSLLLTNWGERVNHYYFGCNFKEFLFENIHPAELKSRIGERILSQVETWLPFLAIETLNVNLTEDDSNLPENGVGIRIDFKLIAKPDLSSRLEIVVAQ